MGRRGAPLPGPPPEDRPPPAAYKGRASLPFLDSDEIDLESIEACLVTHFHHDHCAALPYLVGWTDPPFRGKVLMTHPTRAVLGTLLRDTVRLAKASGEESLYTVADVEETMRRTETISYRQTKDLNGISVTALAAGHVLGACMFLVEWDGLRLLYTGEGRGDRGTPRPPHPARRARRRPAPPAAPDAAPGPSPPPPPQGTTAGSRTGTSWRRTSPTTRRTW